MNNHYLHTLFSEKYFSSNALKIGIFLSLKTFSTPKNTSENHTCGGGGGGGGGKEEEGENTSKNFVEVL